VAGSVLVVEDEREIRELPHRYLERAGLPVLTTAGGAGAIRILSAGSAWLVLLDLKENHHVPSSHLPEMRQDYLGRLRPARQPGAGRRPSLPALRRPRKRSRRQQQRRLAAQALRPRLSRRHITAKSARARAMRQRRGDRHWDHERDED
jgi:CheY-like chemotaxis protein